MCSPPEPCGNGSAKGALTVVEYGERYNYLEQADVIISATESPHHTLTAGGRQFHDGSERLYRRACGYGQGYRNLPAAG